MKVLAIGATGANAGLVVPELVKRGVEVRGLVRDPAKADAARRNGAGEVVVADLHDVDELTAAAEGVDGVFGVIPAFADDEAGIGLSMVQAAAQAGARRFVFSSVYHPSLPLSNHLSKQPAETALYESDLDFTILQPAIFMQQIGGLVRSARQSGVVAQPYSADAQMAYVDYRDVAEVAAEAFVSERFSYGTFELAAPGMYSRHALAQLIGEALGRPVRAETMPLPRAAGAVEEGLNTMLTHYDRHGFHGGNPLVLTALLGCEPRTVPDYIAAAARP